MMENAELTAKQSAFLRAVGSGPKWAPDFWPKWLTDLWFRDFFETRGPALYLTAKGKAEVERLEAAAGPPQHELVVVVGSSSRVAAVSAWPDIVLELQRAVPDFAFTLHVAEVDFVDGGRFMVIPSRGSIGEGQGLRPVPLDNVINAAGEALERLAFLEPVSVQ